MRARRGLLYMPGDDGHKIRKAAGLGVDCVCMDLEDGVAFDRKAEARATVAESLLTVDFGRSEKLVRVNAIGSGLEVPDLDALLSGGPDIRPDGIVLPKVEAANQVRWLSSRLSEAEAAQGWPEGGIGIFVLIETALGVVNVREILSAEPRLRAAIFGAEDLAGDIGMTRTRGAMEVLYARSAVVTHAAAFGLQAIDIVFVDFRDVEGLRAESLEGAGMGFSGKQLIHPAQVAPAQEAYTPSDEAVAKAIRIVEAFEANQREGRGAFALDGAMVDMPIVKAARRVLDRAGAAGRLTRVETSRGKDPRS
ncbi:MAG: CoA ester lyase [Treponema sp.]|nr:CoA ester lyase [Treponema sp.]